MAISVSNLFSRGLQAEQQPDDQLTTSTKSMAQAFSSVDQNSLTLTKEDDSIPLTFEELVPEVF
jgi:hypothetical protein